MAIGRSNHPSTVDDVRALGVRTPTARTHKRPTVGTIWTRQ